MGLRLTGDGRGFGRVLVVGVAVALVAVLQVGSVSAHVHASSVPVAASFRLRAVAGSGRYLVLHQVRGAGGR